jgi:hypothetical protein
MNNFEARGLPSLRLTLTGHRLLHDCECLGTYQRRVDANKALRLVKLASALSGVIPPPKPREVEYRLSDYSTWK